MFFFTIYLLHTGQRKHLEIFIFLKKKHRDAKVKPKKRLLMGEKCILMDVEQVTSNRCAQISRVRHENRWWDLKMSKSLRSVNTLVAIKCKTRSSATLFISNVCLSLQVSALCCFIQRYCISQCFFFFFFSSPSHAPSIRCSGAVWGSYFFY